MPKKLRFYTVFSIAILLFGTGQCLEFFFLLHGGYDLADLCQWDCGWYGSIASDGYHDEPSGHASHDAANWAFFPAFPYIVRALHSLVAWPLDLALVITSKLFLFTGVVSFILFARAWEPKISPWIAGLVVVFNPYSIYGNAGYTESLFLTLTCLSFWLLKQDRYALSGAVAGLLSATRFVGGSFGFAYLFRMVSRWGRSTNRLDMLLGLFLIPAGLAAYMFYLHLHTGDALGFSHIQVAWNREPGNPVSHLLGVFKGGWFHWLVGISIAVAALAMVYLTRAKHYELLIFSLWATLVPLATGLVSMPRFIWWQAPVLFAVAVFLNRFRWPSLIYVAISISFSYTLYSTWFVGANWVI